MERIVVGQGKAAEAAAEGRQHFVGGGPGSVVRLNGNPADYRLEQAASAAAGGYILVATNGTGEYRIDAAIERVRFVSGAFSLLRNLPAVVAAGDRAAQRLAATRRLTSHAQIREDVLLMRALGQVDPSDGFYIDVGAYDPDTDSVTRMFYELGWRGINLEPSPAHHRALCARRPRDVNLCVAASAAAGRMRFFRNDGEQLGTLEPRFAGDGAAPAIEVPVVRLADICRAHAPRDIHFLKIDVEGHERSVLEGCDFTSLRPWIVVVEAVAPNRADVATFGEWEDILIDAGYVLAAEDELNRYYLAAERAELAGFFSQPVDHYVCGRDAAERERLTRLVAELRAGLAAREGTPADRPGRWARLRRWASRLGRSRQAA